MSIRRFLERWSRDRVVSRTLRTPAGARRIFASPEASLRYLNPFAEINDQPLFDFCQRFVRFGNKVWDIGANIGIFTFSAAAAVGPSGSIVAVEADPFSSWLLNRSCALVPATDAQPTVISVAISDRPGIERFAVAERSRASNHLLRSPGCTQTGGTRQVNHVLTTDLNWLRSQVGDPDVIKMDIEGMEFLAFEAAPQLLSEVRPVLNVEVWEEIADDLSRLLSAHDYALFDGESDLHLKNPLTRTTWSTIAIPREKLSAYC